MEPRIQTPRCGTLTRLLALLTAMLLPLCAAPAGAQDADTAQGAAQGNSTAAETPAGSAAPRVVLETTLGDIVLELDPGKAPGTVENFLTYVRDGFYDGTIFHRVIPDFMIQGGGFTPDLQQKPTRPSIQNEADNGLKNRRGTLAMARTSNPHSATAQFFINVVDNHYLDHTAKTGKGWGYTVFGRVVEGMDVVDAIAATPTTRRGSQPNLPVDAVVIRKASVVE
jgi:peptidyl-prolyl cis-trans isomerase B (cyclophilin B)